MCHINSIRMQYITQAPSYGIHRIEYMPDPPKLLSDDFLILDLLLRSLHH